jgi:uncharacterized membrane protein YbaN (DUF454 family)
MFTKLKHEWQQLRRSPPGKRFQRRFDARLNGPAGPSSLLRRLIVIGLAVIFFAIGIVLVFIPGPAILFFFLAGALLAEESRAIARLLDWLELRVRAIWRPLKAWWKRRTQAAKLSVAISFAIVAGAVTYGSFKVMF